ncbi:MAG TPA: hypothetical protein VK780_00695, partial [Thermoanaerobaculia bacterium]|nr:hypothetical protein [Thermoanaerobaculia bacterium]
PYLLDYFGQEQEFANSESSDFFASKGLALPSPDVYLPGVLDYYLRAPADDRLQATRGRMAAGSSRV